MVIAIDKMTRSPFLQENIVLGDFGQSYFTAARPADYHPATIINYVSPEARFDDRAGLEADVWGLGLTIFAIRTGAHLFSDFMASTRTVLVEMLQTLGRPPERWCKKIKEHDGSKDDSGSDDQEHPLVLKNIVSTAPLRDILRDVGSEDEPPMEGEDDGPMIEKTGTRIPDEEVELLGDLLGKMLKYEPEERITMEEVVEHPWFKL